ncbi:MAG TPA: YXWGXW repeat-containing protein [Candidatus Acidoferrales bacterium]|nr:YXWGXW repeat-containing protein [Candidatus Acidoferrales bacterium]
MRKTHIIYILLVAALMLVLPATSSAQIAVGISVHIGPPILPVYAQPICPGAGYLWTPGYWSYGDAGYYWVPGTWVIAPVGMLWTPGYWGWGGGAYLWHVGYWGPHIGFYGGINYGFGYGGVGFVGGRWNGGVFAYNTAVMHVDTTVIHTTYVDRTVVNTTVVNNHVAFNGGAGGVQAQPTAAETAAANEQHVPPTAEQTQHEHAASTNTALRYSENHGQPAVAASAHAGEFTGHGVVAARASFHPPANSTNGSHGTTNTSTVKTNSTNSGQGNSANGGHPSSKPPAHPAKEAKNPPPPKEKEKKPEKF